MKEELAKIIQADIEIEDHGMLIPLITLQYELGEQTFCPIIDGPAGSQVIKAVMIAANVSRFSTLVGRYVIAIIDDGLIRGMKPLQCEKQGVGFHLNDFAANL